MHNAYCTQHCILIAMFFVCSKYGWIRKSRAAAILIVEKLIMWKYLYVLIWIISFVIYWWLFDTRWNTTWTYCVLCNHLTLYLKHHMLLLFSAPKMLFWIWKQTRNSFDCISSENFYKSAISCFAAMGYAKSLSSWNAKNFMYICTCAWKTSDQFKF